MFHGHPLYVLGGIVPCPRGVSDGVGVLLPSMPVYHARAGVEHVGHPDKARG